MPKKIRYTGKAPCNVAVGSGPSTAWQPGQVHIVTDEEARDLVEMGGFEAVAGATTETVETVEPTTPAPEEATSTTETVEPTIAAVAPPPSAPTTDAFTWNKGGTSNGE